ncbi:MAG: YraN family protein [Bacteroidales bacterium]|jgi:putative endonuclease|nr:YraN family protein [Bacteroidales bacterium]
MAEHNDLGKKGEQIAAEYLEKNGYRIRERNWHNFHQEIDIIAEKEGELIIVEVKCRRDKPMVEGFVAVNRNKQNLLIRAANAYIIKKNTHMDTRFDIISITINDTIHIEHIEGAFYPMYKK